MNIKKFNDEHKLGFDSQDLDYYNKLFDKLQDPQC